MWEENQLRPSPSESVSQCPAAALAAPDTTMGETSAKLEQLFTNGKCYRPASCAA